MLDHSIHEKILPNFQSKNSLVQPEMRDLLYNSEMQSIISLKFPISRKTVWKRGEEIMAHLTRETGHLSSPDTAGKMNGQNLL